MNEKFFGDKCDLVKWSVLLHLADPDKRPLIIQVCFRTKYEFPEKDISVDGKPCISVHDDVMRHFRSLRSVERMPRNGVEVRVFCHCIEPRENYVAKAISFIGTCSNEPCFANKGRIVLLDPDTGLAPNGGCTLRHITRDDIQRVWKELTRKDDILVVYQHRPQRCRRDDWRRDGEEPFTEAINDRSVEIHRAESREIAPDVAFFYVRRG